MILNLILRLRHLFYDKGWKKSFKAEVPTICVGNITVGGTGKTPHCELVIRTLLESQEWQGKQIALLSRGYKRRSRGFQQVSLDGSAELFGDEPLQIKKKFPNVTVVVDSDRVRACKYLCHPELVKDNAKLIYKDFPKADVIVLDDAFQHRRLKADLNIVLVNWNRPIFKDRLLPFGRLRDIPSRIKKADAIIVTKCPHLLEDELKVEFTQRLGLKDYSLESCTASNSEGKTQTVVFSTIDYCDNKTVYPSTDSRYFYAKNVVAFTAIASDRPFCNYLSSRYKIVSHISLPDHHKFSRQDIAKLLSAVQDFPTCAVATTEKDVQRMLDCPNVPEIIKARIFYVPIKASFMTPLEEDEFKRFLMQSLRRS